MNILVTGASGFIASQIITDLLAAGHNVSCAARNTGFTKRLFPNATVIRCDFIRDTQEETWLDRLINIDLVINCVGILYHPNKEIIWAIHDKTPRALFKACVKMKVKKIIQISALGVDHSDVDYAKSKKAADDYLQSLSINSVILRPSLVYGRGSYGGTSLFRGLAGLPWITPVPGSGKQTFQPVHIKDLSKAVLTLATANTNEKLLLHAVSKKKVDLTGILSTMRSWLGFPSSLILKVPLFLIRIGSKFGDFIPYSAMNSTSYKMMMQDNVTSDEEANKFEAVIGFQVRNFTQGIYSDPASVQDRWHARLFFLRPVLQFSIAFIWLFTAVCSLFFYPKSDAYQLLTQAGISAFWQPALLYGASIINGLIGLAMLIGFQLKKTCQLQILLILVYTAIITFLLPYLWLEPFAPIAKNIPLLAAILSFMALESDR